MFRDQERRSLDIRGGCDLPTVLTLFLVLVIFLTAPASAEVKDEVQERAIKQLGKTAAKKAIPLVNVATTAYEATQIVMDGLNVINTIGNVITGITKDQPWAVAHTDVAWLGKATDSDTDATHAAASESHYASVWGYVWGANVTAEAWDTGKIMIDGESQGSASWIGLAGVGLKNIDAGGDALGKVIVKKLNQLLDPYNSPVIDPQDPDFDTESDREKTLLDPSGFDYFLRVYGPSTDPDTPGPMLFEAEIFGFLEAVDPEAENPQDAFQPSVYAVADYYDPGGPVTRKEGSDVTNLSSGSFTYFEDTAMLQGGEVLDVFGYQLTDFDMEIYLDIPQGWYDSPGEYLHIDFQAINGGVSTGATPHPAPSISTWGLVVLSMLLLAAGAAAIKRLGVLRWV